MSAPFIPSAPADLELIAQLKSELQYAELRIRVLEERLRVMRIKKYGAGGEKLSQAQMQLFELEPAVSEMIEQVESDHAPVHRSTKKSGKHPGRQELPANLPRVERILPCTPDQRECKRCGKETVVIGYEESSQLDVEPAKYFVLVTKREKRAFERIWRRARHRQGIGRALCNGRQPAPSGDEDAAGLCQTDRSEGTRISIHSLHESALRRSRITIKG